MNPNNPGDIEDVIWCDNCQKYPAASEAQGLCDACLAEQERERAADDAPFTADPIDTLYEYNRDMGIDDDSIPF